MCKSYEIAGSVIIRRFSGKTGLTDIINSWENIFEKEGDIKKYSGVITDLLNADLNLDLQGLGQLMEYIKENSHLMGKTKLAVLMSDTKVILPILANREHKDIEIRPFYTEKAAIEWIEH